MQPASTSCMNAITKAYGCFQALLPTLLFFQQLVAYNRIMPMPETSATVAMSAIGRRPDSTLDGAL